MAGESPALTEAALEDLIVLMRAAQKNGGAELSIIPSLMIVPDERIDDATDEEGARD